MELFYITGASLIIVSEAGLHAPGPPSGIYPDEIGLITPFNRLWFSFSICVQSSRQAMTGRSVHGWIVSTTNKTTNKMKMKMKNSKLWVAAFAAIGLQVISVPSGSAQDFYRANVSAIGIATNQAGDLTYYRFGNRDLIRHCTGEQGITNLTGLSLAYDRTADALVVVSGTNNTVLCTPLTFAGGTSLSNTNGTKIQRLTWVYWETNQVASGTLLAGEKVFPATTNHPASFSLQGQLQFTVPGDSTNGPVIYAGIISAGSKFCDWGDFDHEH